MATDTNWTWTILMKDGKSYHAHTSITIHKLLEYFYAHGHHEAEIEAIIRH